MSIFDHFRKNDIHRLKTASKRMHDAAKEIDAIISDAARTKGSWSGRGVRMHDWTDNQFIDYAREHEYRVHGDEPDSEIPYEYAIARHIDRALDPVHTWFIDHWDELEHIDGFEHASKMLSAAASQSNSLDCYLRDIHYGLRDDTGKRI